MKNHQGKPLKHSKPISGFTLIELIISISVIAVLLALALPAFQEFTRNNRRAAAVNEFMAAGNLARAEALRRSSAVTLCRTNQPTAAAGAVDPDCGNGPNGWEDGWIIFADLNQDNDWDAGEPLIQASQAIDGDISITGTGTTATRIRYTPNGELQPGINNGTLRVCNTSDNGARGRDIILAPVGKLRSEENNTYTSCPPP
ncbi:MAG: GspH/FimT family protein [Salinisphaeraceae bacterium]|nr:GspH/FimT family protein [Salinisphaeraceae bacterium]